MTLVQVALRLAHGACRVGLRELTGCDEQSVGDTSTATAIRLLDRLIESAPDRSWQVAELTASDRDRLLAALYRHTYGTRVASTSCCTQCSNLFDVTFGLDDLLTAFERMPATQVAEPLPDGTFRTANGARFRLPTGADEVAVAALPPEEAAQALLARCLMEVPAEVDVRASVEEAMEEIAPLLDLDLNTACPECGVRQTIHFDVQFYLLRTLEQERVQVTREVHRIATAYGWGLNEILSLRRSERRRFVELIEAELSVRRRLS